MARDRLATTALAIAASLAVLVPASVRAADVRIEAESYTESHDVALGIIRNVSGVLYGLDSPGEWTRYDLTADVAGTYGVLMHCWGELGVEHHLQLSVENPGESPLTVDFRFYGRGPCGH